MSARTFAPWVAPIAAQLREGRTQVLGFARSVPAEAWARPSPLEGWTCKDILAHLAGGNDGMVQKILRSVVAREPVDRSVLATDTDAENARGVEERRGWSVEELIAELEADGQESQELLSRLTEADEDLRQDDLPLGLGEFLALVHAEDHDGLHLAQLRTALR